MFDQAYESYKKKCKELGVKPSSKKEIFGEDIIREKNNNHLSISELSRARKEKVPVLSETAKKALVVQTNKRVIKTPKPKKVVKKKLKIVSPKRVLLSDEQKKANAKEKARLYHLKMKDDLAYQERRKARDRGRKQQRKDYMKNNPEAYERKKARDRERYAKNKADPKKHKKLLVKWKKDGERKRAAA